MKLKSRHIAFLSLACLLPWSAGDRATAFSYFEFGGVKVVWLGAQSVRCLSPTTFPEGSEPDTIILASMGLWNIVPLCDFEYFFNRLLQDFPIDHFDGFNDTAAVPAATLDPGVLGVTYLVNSGAQWFDMDVLFSDLPEGIGWTMETNPDCEVVANPLPNNGFSFLLVAVHELGHALGLGHDPIGDEPPGASWFIQTMNPRYPNAGPVGQENIIELHTEDRRGARFLYPHGGPSGPPLVDLANAGYTTGPILGKSIPVFFDTPGVLPEILPGEELIVRSVIENFGTTNEFMVRHGFYLSTDEIIDAGDLPIGDILWDMPFEDGFEYDAVIDMPADIPAGDYYVGSILDDLDEIAEEFEDNNAVVYCDLLTVNQLQPQINPIGQEIVNCGEPYTGPAPTVTAPLNMNPITWSLDNPEPGMTIDENTGVISWPSPVRSPFLYTLIVRATNTGGTDTDTFFLGVDAGPPNIVPLPDQCISSGPYTGPTPQVSDPPCMLPIINWSLDTAPPGMTINFATGITSWPAPSGGPHVVTIRATNAVGNGIMSWTLTVGGDGDVDQSGTLDLNDVAPFASVLVGLDTDPDHVAAADINCDGASDGRDIQPFVESIMNGP
ncbi:MAG: putative Ig domain-containing protein [Planctomycetota bacterium]|nr:putative Ig domain-containing protein [Planctomycetota bacterium]